MAIPRLRLSRPRSVSLFGLTSALALVGCYEEQVGPELTTPPPSNSVCFALREKPPEELKSPEGLLLLFDCLNSQQAFDALRSPIAYLVAADHLDPYFLEGYFDPLHLDENIQGGDLSATLTGLETLLNDPDDPLGALLDVYLDLHDTGHLEALLRLSQVYSSYLAETCTFQSCPMMDIANDLYSSEDLALVQENSAAIAAQIDPRTAEDLAYDVMYLARESASDRSPTGENLMLSLAAAFTIRPAPSDEHKSIDDFYVAKGSTLLQELQKPLCQLRSDRQMIAAMQEQSAEMYNSGTLSYLPLYLRTLNNYSPVGHPATTAAADRSDADQDGASIADGDCNDTDPEIRPYAAEGTDGRDRDCNLVAGNALLESTQNQDLDKDRVSPRQGDCNDLDASIHPGLKIYESNGGITVIEPGAEFPVDAESGLAVADGKDNDCDGFTDHVPSSLEILLGNAKTMLGMLYEEDPATGETTLDYLVQTMAKQADSTLDIEKLLEANAEVIESTTSNLDNGVLDADVTARLRVMLPVTYQMVDMGLISSSALKVVAAIDTDHDQYVAAREQAKSEGTVDLFDDYANACGEGYDDRVDTLKVLDEVVKLVDAWSILDDPSLNALLPLAINSDLLMDYVEIYPLSLDENGERDPEVMEATLRLFDYFMAPPEGSSLHADDYAAARLWTVMPMMEKLFEDQSRVDELDALLIYALDGIEDPLSPLYGVPDALEALQGLETGGTVDRDGLITALLDPDARYILLNMLSMAGDPNLTAILVGDWEALPEDIRGIYENRESTLEFSARWIREGVADAMLDLAGDLLTWVVDNTSLDEISNATPTPTPEPPTGG